MEREKFKSRLGFILISAGCAIGIGNVWRFPYVVGSNGGGLFVLIYILFLVIMGVPVMTMELAMGRNSRKSIVCAYKDLEKPGQKWHIQGYIAMIANYVLMIYYTTVAGWMLYYFVSMLLGKFEGADTEQVATIFNELMSRPGLMMFCTVFVIVIGFIVCSLGLQNGVERISKVMMIALLVIMVVLAINSIFLDGAEEGLKFYLIPDIQQVKDIGIGKVIMEAMNQAFFTLSLGVGSMEIFGSYIDKDKSLLGESVTIAVLDTFVAVVAGLIIFPACFAYGVSPDSGPSLIFKTLPNIFNAMAGSRIWGSLFFLFMSFAAFSTVIAVFENIMSFALDLFSMGRKKAALINCIIITICSVPCVLGFNVLASVQPLGSGSTILDLEDFLMSNIFLPVGAIILVLFCVTKFGWGFDKYIEETNQGSGMKMPRWIRGYCVYVVPVIILILLISGLV